MDTITIELIPLKGLLIAHKEFIPFGLKKQRVLELIDEEIDTVDERNYYFYNGQLILGFDDEDALESICVSRAPEIKALAFGEEFLQMYDSDLLRFLAAHLSSELETDLEISSLYAYDFQSAGISVWRPISPKDVLDSEEDAKKDGLFEEWMANELEPSKHFKGITLHSHPFLISSFSNSSS